MTKYNNMMDLAREFEAELRRLHQRMDWSNYASSSLDLRVTFSRDKSTAEIEASVGPDYPKVVVKGLDLGKVMDEVYRRLNYEDKAKWEIEQSLRALPGPEEGPEEGVS